MLGALPGASLGVLLPASLPRERLQATSWLLLSRLLLLLLLLLSRLLLLLLLLHALFPLHCPPIQPAHAPQGAQPQ